MARGILRAAPSTLTWVVFRIEMSRFVLIHVNTCRSTTAERLSIVTSSRVSRTARHWRPSRIAAVNTPFWRMSSSYAHWPAAAAYRTTLSVRQRQLPEQRSCRAQLRYPVHRVRHLLKCVVDTETPCSNEQCDGLGGIESIGSHYARGCLRMQGARRGERSGGTGIVPANLNDDRNDETRHRGRR